MEIASALLVPLLVAAAVAVIGVIFFILQPAPSSNHSSSRPSRNSQHRSSAHHSHYRTSDGRADYTFSFEQQGDGTWRAYIVSQPSYRRRSKDYHSTHRLPDGRRKYICWDSSIYSFEQLKQVAAMWANATQKYIRTGRRF